MGIESYSTTPASNNSSPPAGAPEHMFASDVNNSMRQQMADTRSFYETMEFRNLGHSISYVTGTSFRVNSADVTSIYNANRCLKITGATTGTVYGKIISSSFSTNTLVSIELDSGTLQNETLTVSLGFSTEKSISYDSIRSAGKFSIGKTSELTIASGVVTVTGGKHTIDSEGDASSDDLNTINGGIDGAVVMIQPANGSRTINVKHLTGNINLSGNQDYVMDEIDKMIFLAYDATNSQWWEIARKDGNASFVNLTVSGNLTASSLSADNMINMVCAFPVSSVNSRWLECNGAYVSKTTYAKLYAKMGNTYGSSGSNFRLPNYRNMFLRGYTSGRSIGSYQADEFKSHRHTIYNGFTNTYAEPYNGGVGTGFHMNNDKYTSYTGGSETRPKNYAVKWCVYAG